MKNITSTFLSFLKKKMNQQKEILSQNLIRKPAFKVIYFYHIPKCGGTYTLRLLQKFQRKLNSDFVIFNINKQKRNLKAEAEQLSFLNSLQSYSANKVLIIYQHMGFPGINDLYEDLRIIKKEVKKNKGEIVFITMIREPMSHIRSMVNYNRRKNKDINFDSVPSGSIVYDKMSKFFLYGQRKRWKNKEIQIDRELLNKNIRLFDYIFTLERLDLLIDFLNHFLGTKDVFISKKINASKIELLPTKDQKKRFLDNIYWDKYFYEVVSKKGPNVKNMFP